MGKIFKYKVVDFSKGIDLIALCDELEDAKKVQAENKTATSDIFIMIYDDTLKTYIMTRYGK